MTPAPRTRGHALAGTLAAGMPLFERFLVGFDDTNLTRQAPNLPNHAAWTMGHLALTTHRCADKLAGHSDPQPLPDADFRAPGSPPDPQRFDPESVAFASTPTPDPARYPCWEACRRAYEAGHHRLIAALRAAPDADLDRPVPWGSTTITGDELATRMLFHLGTHTGQIVDLRRALAMPRVVG